MNIKLGENESEDENCIESEKWFEMVNKSDEVNDIEGKKFEYVNWKLFENGSDIVNDSLNVKYSVSEKWFDLENGDENEKNFEAVKIDESSNISDGLNSIDFENLFVSENNSVPEKYSVGVNWNDFENALLSEKVFDALNASLSVKGFE
mgnify:CR=1 FL=1